MLAVPITSIAKDLQDFPDPDLPHHMNNVGLVAVEGAVLPYAEFSALFVSSELLKQVGTWASGACLCFSSWAAYHVPSVSVCLQGDPWYAALGVNKLVAERKVHVLRPEMMWKRSSVALFVKFEIILR
jgi:hypothetical protein